MVRRQHIPVVPPRIPGWARQQLEYLRQYRIVWIEERPAKRTYARPSIAGAYLSRACVDELVVCFDDE